MENNGDRAQTCCIVLFQDGSFRDRVKATKNPETDSGILIAEKSRKSRVGADVHKNERIEQDFARRAHVSVFEFIWPA